MTEIVFRSDMDVELVDSMGSDLSIAQAAWVSTQGAGAQGAGGGEADEERVRGLIRFLLRNRHGCYDDQTEVLTSDGWKRWPDVTGNESFATLNLEIDTIEYQRAQRLIRQQYNGPMIQIRKAHADLLVTPDHRMVAAPRVHTLEENYALVPASDFMVRSHRVRMGGGHWEGEGLHVPEIAELIGFITADAHVSRDGHIEFNLRKQRKIQWLAERAELTLSHDGKKRYLTNVTEVVKLWAKQTYTDTRERCFPRELLERGDQETVAALLDGYLQGDGSVSPTGKITCTTVSKQLRDDIQEAALKAGIAARVTKSIPAGARTSFPGAVPKELHRITIYRDRNLCPRVGWTYDARQEEVQTVDYSGEVFCVTVPNGTLYVRRNGVPAWCGNSPLEHNSMTFAVRAPIFVWREHHRHRVGFCLAGSSQIPVGTQKNGSTKSIENVYRDWKLGVPDSLGRVRKLPACQNLITRTLNLKTGLVEYAPMVDVYQSGVKPILEIEFMNAKRRRTLRCTADHRVWTDTGWVRAGDLRVGDHIARQGKVVTGKRNGIPKRLRAGIQEWTTQQKPSIINPVDKCHVCKNDFVYADLELDHKVPVSENIELALVRSNLRPICVKCHTKKSGFESWSDGVARRPVTTGVRFTPVLGIRDGGEEMTYDIEMPAPWHNFIADDVVVHNSYNEESGRYSQLQPEFYLPDDSRGIKQVGKPGAYEYVPDAEKAAQVRDVIRYNSREAYLMYESMLRSGVAREVARMVLPVNIYSSCFVTMNARSLMNFLSLRTRREGSAYPSFPQREIEMVAEKYEAVFAQLFPFAYEAFNEFGRAGG